MLSFRNDDYVFGLVKDLFIISGDLYILCNTLEIELFDTHFNAYQVVESAEDCLVKSVNLLHHHPIGIYVLEDKQYVVMHTFVPYEFIHWFILVPWLNWDDRGVVLVHLKKNFKFSNTFWSL